MLKPLYIKVTECLNVCMLLTGGKIKFMPECPLHAIMEWIVRRKTVVMNNHKHVLNLESIKSNENCGRNELELN